MLITDPDDRPNHSIDDADQMKKPGGHEVDAPEERTDDEVSTDEGKTTKRQE